MRTLIAILVVLAALYGIVCLLAFVFQRRLLYVPSRYPEAAALAAAKRLGLEPWRDRSGALAGWRAAPRGPAVARALVLHGNGGSALDRTDIAAGLSGAGVEVVLLEYPGYGARPGQPSLGTLGAAAADALDQLGAQGGARIWVVGESLGSGVAGRAVALRPGAVHGLVLLTPLARMRDLVRLHYPLLPSLLLRDRYAPEDDLAGFHGPAVLVLAGRDEVVGIDQGRRLAERLPGPKRVVVQDAAAHNGLELDPEGPLWPEVVGFLAAGSSR
jgi:pimeloyl-ACP methyl ester carboxylesterase